MTEDLKIMVPTTCVDCGARGEREGYPGMVHMTIVCTGCAKKRNERGLEPMGGTNSYEEYLDELFKRQEDQGKDLGDLPSSLTTEGKGTIK